MSNHLMQRLNIAREDPGIRQALPPGSFRTHQQAAVEARLMRAAAMSKLMGAAGAAAGAAGAAPPQAAPPARTNTAHSGMVLPRGLRPATAPASPASPAAAAAPALPHVFRRARQTVQISDPATGDLLQLDAGTWVLTDAAAHAATNTLKIYTTDADSGAVMAYDIPMGSGAISDYFDLHTFNPLETAGAPESS
jgi:hypothetical protein